MLITLIILAGLPILLPVNSVLSTDDEFFVISEDVYYDRADYGLKPSLSPVAEKFGNVNGSYKENDGQFVDSQNFSDFNFALAGNWGYTKNTEKTVELIQKQNPNILFATTTRLKV